LGEPNLPEEKEKKIESGGNRGTRRGHVQRKKKDRDKEVFSRKQRNVEKVIRPAGFQGGAKESPTELEKEKGIREGRKGEGRGQAEKGSMPVKNVKVFCKERDQQGGSLI